jgi:hypothetical protein
VNTDLEVEKKMKQIGQKLNLSDFIHQGNPVGPITACNVFRGTVCEGDVSMKKRKKERKNFEEKKNMKTIKFIFLHLG